MTQELRMSEEKFRTIAEQSMLAICIVQDGIVKYANKGSALLSERDQDEIVGLRLTEYIPIVHPDDQVVVKGLFGKIEKEPNIVNGDLVFRIISKSGKIKWIEAFIKKFLFDDRNAFSITALDITAKIRAENRLRESESRYRMITGNVTDIIWTMDLNEKMTFISPAVTRILGYSVGEAVGMTLSKFLTPSSYQSARELLVANLGILPPGEEENLIRNPIVVELDHVCKNGSTKWCEVSNLMLFDEKGRPTGVIGVTRDISDRKASQEKLLHYQLRLRALTSEISLVEQRERRKIAGDLHDRIGQTLAAAKIKLGSLKASMPPEFSTKDVSDITDMIDQTMRDTRTLTFELSPPILYELGLAAAVDWLLEEIEESYNIRCKLIVEGEPIKLSDDLRVLMFRIIRELIINVTKHADAKLLKIRMSFGVTRIAVVVEDDGKGFDVSKIRPEDHRNVGFGLFNARERLEHMGGDFTISSFAGKGTKVAFWTPLDELNSGQSARRKSG